MIDFPLTDDVVLLNSGDTARKGLYVEFGLFKQIDGPIHPDSGNPFNELTQGREKGQRFRITITPLAEDEATLESAEEAEQTQTAPEATPAPKSTDGWSEAKRKMVQRSGIVRNEEAFHRHIAKNWPSVWNHPAYDGLLDKEKAVQVLHYWCGVDSCRDLDPEGESGEAFRNIMRKYDAAMEGRTPEALAEQARSGP